MAIASHDIEIEFESGAILTELWEKPHAAFHFGQHDTPRMCGIAILIATFWKTLHFTTKLKAFDALGKKETTIPRLPIKQ